MNKNKIWISLVPLMLCFFTMGFVDLVGIASNYVKEDLRLTDAEASLFPSLLFFWFLIFSVPTGMLMNKIGRKKTVLVSLMVTALSLLLPVFGENYPIMLLSFSLLGIGNTLLQTSLNPLLSCIVSGRSLASSLTFGQFVKAIASFLAPYIATWGATQAMPEFGLSWRILFPVYLVVGLLAFLLLGWTPIEEEKPEGKASTFMECLGLLGKPAILVFFIGIICHVGIDVGTNMTAPKLLMERVNMTLTEAAFATSLYFIFRTIGSFTGSFILRHMSAKTFFFFSVGLLFVALVMMAVASSEMWIYIAVAVMGYGNSNIFSVIFASALGTLPDKKNEVSGLLIMGLFGGTIFPLCMGFASDAIGQLGAVLVMAVGVCYLFYCATKIRD